MTPRVGQRATVRTHTSARASATRSAIVEAATEIISARGYDGASLREISDRVGITKGNLTYHFSVKEELLFAIMDDVHDIFLLFAQDWPNLRADDPDEALRIAFRQHVALVTKYPDATRIFYESFRNLTFDHRDVIIRKRDRYEKALRVLIARCRPELGSPTGREVRLRARIVIGTLSWPYEWFDPNGPWKASYVNEVTADMAVRALHA